MMVMKRGPGGLPPPQGSQPLPGVQPKMFIAITTLMGRVPPLNAAAIC